MSAKILNVLAIETATSHGTIALAVGDQILESVCIGETAEHSKVLVPRILDLLKTHKTRPTDLDLICVSKGPGSFTGIRVGVACAKGFALGLGIPLVGISTLEALLAGFLHDTHWTNSLAPKLDKKTGAHFSLSLLGERGRVKGGHRIALLMDSKKGEFFLQFWRAATKTDRNVSWVPQAPAVLKDQEVITKFSSGWPKSCVLVSPQLSKLRGLLAGHAAQGIVWDIKDRFPDALDVALLGMEIFRRQKKGDADLRPLYLRKTDAEILFKNKSRSVFKWERPNLPLPSGERVGVRG